MGIQVFYTFSLYTYYIKQNNLQTDSRKIHSYYNDNLIIAIITVGDQTFN